MGLFFCPSQLGQNWDKIGNQKPSWLSDFLRIWAGGPANKTVKLTTGGLAAVTPSACGKFDGLHPLLIRIIELVSVVGHHLGILVSDPILNLSLGDAAGGTLACVPLPRLNR